MTAQHKTVGIVGGGLAGSLMALYLAQRGQHVDVYERRPDLRRRVIDGGRSINLALSLRGLRALHEVGLADDLLRIAIPMRGRMIHDLAGGINYQPYGRSDDYYINSVSRGDLNATLLTAAEQSPNVQMHFEHRCTHADLKAGRIVLENQENGQVVEKQHDILLGTDGYGSAIRDAYLHRPRFNYSQDYLSHCYKELTLPAGPNGEFLIEKNALHIWPRGRFMLIALPNLGGSFTCTLFLDYEGDELSFEQLTTEQDVERFFEHYFVDALRLIPDLAEQFFRNPTGQLATVRCGPWHAEGRVALMGDAAHAIVPFYGQGMNASFEDCAELNRCLDECAGDWPTAFEHYYRRRKPNADAIATLALQNFVEMRDHTANPIYLRKRKLELALEAAYPDRFASKYQMVTFQTRPYAEALAIGDLQDHFLMNLVGEREDMGNLALPDVLAQVEHYVESHLPQSVTN